MTQLLKNWLAQGPLAQQLISFNHHDITTGGRFIQQVSQLHQQLLSHQAQRWLLTAEASDLFAIGLCAGLLAGKELILPANTQPGTLAKLEQEFDGVLSELPIKQQNNYLPLTREINQASDGWPTLPDDCEYGELILFTSGSTGQAKAVRKNVTQLDNEITVLEQTFAKHLPHCGVIATVSHQHIYGLLFKILWPLAASRPFLSDTVETPETIGYYTALFPKLCLVSSPAQLSRMPAVLSGERQPNCPSIIFSSGAPLKLEAAMGVRQCFGSLPVEVYGSTETGAIAYRRQHSSETLWKTFAPIQIAQSDTDNALILTSPFLADNQTLRVDDSISLLGDSLFRLEGRLDRVVKIQEKRLSLEQMESLLRQHAWVANCFLVVRPETKQQLGAAIELSAAGKQQLQANGKPAINAALQLHLSSQFEQDTLPKRWRYVAQLPQTAQGKIAMAEIEKLFSQD
ncbi:AMP-binding protein [Shewanella sp. C32]|uniref:AMP-binding protein n=1 Tax=Shewanella electrica TaxID=515560 RepID=A0ABT2FR74_9GAMM|nr:AMP-binding protein [Shewanella electrica]MCH1926314.1 AMP-binding protein [Shewanella electrica]MCS4557719.1 AMP-binding protein [Shewanella electrica]